MAKRKTCGDQALDPEKAGAGKAPHHCETAHDGQAAYRYQAPDKCQIGRVRSGYRLLRLTAPETWRGSIPQSRHRKRRRKRCRADHHHRKIRLQLTKNSERAFWHASRRLGCLTSARYSRQIPLRAARQ